MTCSAAVTSQTASTLEWDLLVCASRSVVDAGSAGRIRDLVRQGVDWNRLLLLAKTHHVAPLLFRSLSTVCPEAVPPATQSWLERTYTSNVARNLALTRDLLEILESLAAMGIPAIPFKGPTLASAAYGGLALRESGDLDILVRAEDAVRAKDMLVSSEFRLDLKRPENIELEVSNHYVLIRDARPVTVEIHWRLIPPKFCFNLNEEVLWQNTSSTKLAGTKVPCLPTQVLLLYLCAHGTKHCWHRLSWICDIAELVRVERDTDWNQLLDQARAIGAARLLALGLLLAHEILNAPVPESVTRSILADATARALAREVCERYLPDANGQPAFSDMWRLNLRARERAGDRLRCRLRQVRPAFWRNQRDIDFVQLPPRLSFLYHAVKPVRLASEFARNPSRSMRLIGDLVGFRSPL